MEDIIAQAKQLGKLIANHPRTATFMNAAKAVAEDKEAQEVLRSYEETAQHLHELEASGKPIEVADKRKIADLQAKVAGQPKLKAMMKHQADYMELMTRVNNAIEDAIQGADEPGKK